MSIPSKSLAIVALWSLTSTSGAFAAAQTEQLQPTQVLKPKQIVEQTMARHFAEGKPKGSIKDFASHLIVLSELKKPAGVFVTLSSHGKTRACWGSVFPQHDTAAESIVYSTLCALTKEYRFSPVKKSEWKKLKPQVTLVQKVEPITSINAINPLRDGLLVRSGGKAGVLLPGEATDAYYQLVQCKLKAGIKPKESCQMYLLRTKIYD